MPDPQVTVVVVAYRRYDQLPVLIHSFLCQTLQNFKLQILHDGPDERMAALLEDYRQRFPDRIDYAFSPVRHNDYGHSLREWGIARAETPYILLTNDDNYYAPRFLEFFSAPPFASGSAGQEDSELPINFSVQQMTDTAIPEPAGLTAIGLALAALTAIRRRARAGARA